MTRAGEREVVKAEHVNGGAGYILKEALIAGDQLGEHCKMFSQVTIPAGMVSLNFGTYTVSSLLGVFTWNLVFVGAGYFFGDAVWNVLA